MPQGAVFLLIFFGTVKWYDVSKGMKRPIYYPPRYYSLYIPVVITVTHVGAGR